MSQWTPASNRLFLRYLIMQGHVAKVGKIARLYFFIFYLCIVLVVVNVVIACVLTSKPV